MSNKKLGLFIVLCIALLAGAYVACRWLDIFNWYRIPTTSMYPTVIPGQTVFTSVFGKIERGSVVAYKPDAQPGERKDIYMGRIVAIEHDKLEISNGLLYINGQMVDDTTRVGYIFWITCADALNKVPVELHEQHLWPMTPDSGYAGNFTYEDLIKYGLDKCAQRRLDTSVLQNTFVAWAGGAKWSVSNFGPVNVPQNHYFIMGDNRDNSLDSRWRGFIPKSQIISKVINVR